MATVEYLKLLSKEYPNIKKASVEIINLSAILSLPKGTEYFFSDLHGEHEAFIHMLKSASGVIREKIDWIFSKSTAAERDELAALICNPEKVIEKKSIIPDFDEWCRSTIYKLIDICKSTSGKYTRSKVRKRLPIGFDYIMDELLHADDDVNKGFYYTEIINSLIETEVASEFIIELCTTISKLAVDRLHIVGDVFDRGSHPDSIMDYLIKYDNVDFQWGNHDVLWMGAAAGNLQCIAAAIRGNLSYNNFDMIEEGYGINLRPLSAFAYEVYKDDPCERFTPHVFEKNKYDPVDMSLAAKMNKAIAVIQFKLEAQIVRDHPEYDMSERLFFNSIDVNRGKVTIEGREYDLIDSNFPTLIKEDPISLTDDEVEVMRRLKFSFLNSERLQRHIKFMFGYGALYSKFNSNLLYHGCIPMKQDGSFDSIDFGDGEVKGKALFDFFDKKLRDAYFRPNGNSTDIMWYAWCGKKSPLFAKDKMTTFERIFILDKTAHKEITNPYYEHTNKKEVCEKILEEFGLDPSSSHIINGHIPVKRKDGESPIKGDGKLFVIDGGMAKAYRKRTGIAGYTLISNSRYIALAEHHPYEFCEDNYVCQPSPKIHKIEFVKDRITVADTDNGKVIISQRQNLKELVDAFRNGIIKEN